MLGSCHSLYCNVFFGVHNELSKPFVLFLFLLVPSSLLPPPSLLPSPLLLFPPPPTGCAFVTFATRAMAQNAIKTMHHSQTMEVLYPLAPVSHFPSLSPARVIRTCCCPCRVKKMKMKKDKPVQTDGVHSSRSMTHFSKVTRTEYRMTASSCRVIE